MSAFGTTANSASGRPSMIAPQDHTLPQPGGDGITTCTWAPNSNLLVSANWDGGVRCWDVQQQGTVIQSQAKAQGT